MRRATVLALLGGALAAAPAAAQKTEDEPRLIFSMGLAHTGQHDLWAVQGQPVLVPGTGFDLVDLSRNITGGIGVLFSSMYFPTPALGLAGEISFLGVGLATQCAIASPTPNPRTQAVCSSIDGSTKSSSAVLLSVGPVLRVGGNQPISPYVRGQVGLLASNLSPIRTSGSIVVTDTSTMTSERLESVVYNDPSSTRFTPGFVLGAGFTAVLGGGWQLRTEVRDNLVKIATVGGPTPPGNDMPVVINRWTHLFSIVIGADVVLEKKRGRRY